MWNRGFRWAKAFKQDIKRNFIELIARWGLDPSCFQILTQKYSFLMAFALTAVECVRAFSKMKTIKIDKRSSLAHETLNNLMLISIQDPN